MNRDFKKTKTREQVIEAFREFTKGNHLEGEWLVSPSLGCNFQWQRQLRWVWAALEVVFHRPEAFSLKETF